MMAHHNQRQFFISQQAFFNHRGVFLVQGGGSLIHQQRHPLLKQRAGNRDALTLAAREQLASFAHHGIQPLGHSG